MICFIGWHRWLCDFTEIQGDYLLQFFRCKCGKQSEYCGFIKTKWLDAECDRELAKRRKWSAP